MVVLLVISFGRVVVRQLHTSCDLLKSDGKYLTLLNKWFAYKDGKI
jgi:hypothetical protein